MLGVSNLVESKIGKVSFRANQAMAHWGRFPREIGEGSPKMGIFSTSSACRGKKKGDLV